MPRRPCRRFRASPLSPRSARENLGPSRSQTIKQTNDSPEADIGSQTTKHKATKAPSGPTKAKGEERSRNPGPQAQADTSTNESAGTRNQQQAAERQERKGNKGRNSPPRKQRTTGTKTKQPKQPRREREGDRRDGERNGTETNKQRNRERKERTDQNESLVRAELEHARDGSARGAGKARSGKRAYGEWWH